VEIVKRSDTAKGFTVLPKRWLVERTIGWLIPIPADYNPCAQSRIPMEMIAHG
jgi:transposase